jgi:hypothetical protein
MRAYVCFLDVVPRDFDGFDANHGEGETDALASVVPSSNDGARSDKTVLY